MSPAGGAPAPGRPWFRVQGPRVQGALPPLGAARPFTPGVFRPRRSPGAPGFGGIGGWVGGVGLALLLALSAPVAAQVLAAPVAAQVLAAPADLPALMAAAEAGTPEAQLQLGLAYHHGIGLVQNDRAAVVWLTRAAEAGLARAQNLLGRIHHAGLGVPPDQARAERWLGACVAVASS